MRGPAARRAVWKARLALALVAGVVPACTTGAAAGGSAPPSLERLVGQRLVVAMRGTSPTPALLARIRTGQIGGVILFGGNVRTPDQVRTLTSTLRAAARSGGGPPLLIAADQEGGVTRRFDWAAPLLSAAELGRRSTEVVRAQGRATARALRDLGVDVDLAPVADVPARAGSFIVVQKRAFSFDARLVAAVASAFAAGLAEGGVAATAKHFPGLGRAFRSTDRVSVTIGTSRAVLESDLVPYQWLIESGVPVVMLSSAVYTALGPGPATWAPAVQTLLRRELGFAGVTITDALDAPAVRSVRPVRSAAVLAAQAGADLLLVTGSEAESARVYGHLLGAARAGRIPVASLQRSYDRIVALKRHLAAAARP